jgi:FSR family fosmidomycin resistance protein-like MFS transporter
VATADPATPSGLRRAIGAVLLIVLVRGWAYASFNTFIPIIVSIERPDPVLAGIVLSAFMAAHAAGAFGGGIVADRFGLPRVLGYSSLFAIPLIGAFGLLPFGPWHTLLAAAAGGVIGVGFTPSVVLMQRLAPRRIGAASGVVLGVSFGAGAVGNLVTGLVADLSGFGLAFVLIAIGQLVVLASLRWLPAGRSVTAPAPTRRVSA